MQQVRHLLEAKGNAIYSIAPEASVLDAIKHMAEKRVGALLVMRGERLVGIISERDYARKVILQGHSSADTPVSSIMASSPLTVNPDASVAECMRLCTDSRIRHLPVMEGNNVVGVISIGDLVKAVIDEQAQEIEHLQRYIAG
ncbi:MAG TPA: CBS domain-containing protein [Rhodanobacteraceae bacterium]|nr:CBS domain-containing protein [Rhodanobacteraceae bacterium]